MKKKFPNQKVLFGVLLALLSIFFYALHFFIFRDVHYIFSYLLCEIAFVFIQVLLVTVIIEQVLSDREKRAMLNKLNMAIGAFFSEVGTELLKFFNSFDTNANELAQKLNINNKWSEEDFDNITHALANHDYKIDTRTGDLKAMKDFVVGKREFLLGFWKTRTCWSIMTSRNFYGQFFIWPRNCCTGSDLIICLIPIMNIWQVT